MEYIGDWLYWIIPAVILGLATFIAYIFCIIWGYRDAEARGKPGILVAFLILLQWPVGMIIWLLIRPAHKTKFTGGPGDKI